MSQAIHARHFLRTLGRVDLRGLVVAVVVVAVAAVAVAGRGKLKNVR